VILGKNKLGADISLGDWGSINLSDSTTGKVQEGAKSFLPDWLGGILFPEKQTIAAPTKPKIDPIIVGGVAVGALALIMILAMNKKGGGNGGRVRYVTRRAPVRRKRTTKRK